MDDPVAEITGVIETLCTAPPASQQQALEEYFTPDASFTHPFCRTTSSRWQIGKIYLWYKILSPHIDVHIDSIAFDQTNMLLYVGLHQTFKIWVIPFYQAKPSLVTVLKLTCMAEEVPMIKTYAEAVKTKGERSDGQPESSQGSKPKDLAVKQRGSDDGGKKYYIQSQNDLYQTTEFIKFVVPFGGATLMIIWQLWATALCIVGAFFGKPVTWMQDNGSSAKSKRG